MKSFLLQVSTVLLIGLAGPGSLAQTLYLSPDVPTDPDGTFLLPWEVVRHDPTSAAPYGSVLSIPGQPALDALHRMDRAANWLFSVGAANDLGGLFVAEPRDVIRYDAGSYSKFFCGASVPVPLGRVPATASIDAIYLDAAPSGTAGDEGDLIMSFDTPTILGGTVTAIPPSALVRYVPTGGGSCADWQLAGVELDVATIGTYFPGSANITGADRLGGGNWLLSLDIPSDLAPLAAGAPSTFLPGHVVVYDPVNVEFDLFSDLQTSGAVGWQVSGQVDALTCSGNPGQIDPTTSPIRLSKVSLSSDIIIDWSPGGCSQGAENYGVYEGTLSAVVGGAYDHVQIDCDDALGDRQEQVSPIAADSYYLVVPFTTCGEEGSYGADFVAGSMTERPPSGGGRCASIQTLAACP